ncbi:hypothetical protein Dimus_031001 [Dionaea muscipula]
MSVPNNQKVDTERLLVEVTLVHLPSYQQPDDQVQVPYTKPKMMLSHVMTFDATLHGVLLWASMGLIMPVGILLIRMSGRVGGNCGTRIKLLFYVHLVLQILSVLLVTAGAVLSLKSFENSFNNTHQRIGVSLYGAIWVQTCFGFFRPQEAVKVEDCGTWCTGYWVQPSPLWESSTFIQDYKPTKTGLQGECDFGQYYSPSRSLSSLSYTFSRTSTTGIIICKSTKQSSSS